jgi:hypothetical protein
VTFGQTVPVGGLVCNIVEGNEVMCADNLGERFYEFCGGWLRIRGDEKVDRGCDAVVGLVAVSAGA